MEFMVNILVKIKINIFYLVNTINKADNKNMLIDIDTDLYFEYFILEMKYQFVNVDINSGTVIINKLYA